MLASGISEVVGSIEARSHRLRRMHGKTLVHEQLPQCGTAARRPVVVVATAFGYEPAHVTRAGGGCVAHGVGELVSQPDRNEVRRQAHSVGLRVHSPGEVLQADEGYAATAYHQFTGIGATEAYHEVCVSGPIDTDELFGSCDGFFGQPYDVGGCGERVEIAALRSEGGGDDLVGVRGFRVEDVVTPICVEDESVGFAILPIRRFPVGGLQDREKIRKEIDQHARGYEVRG